jgi:hypothetical protein
MKDPSLFGRKLGTAGDQVDHGGRAGAVSAAFVNAFRLRRIVFL